MFHFYLQRVAVQKLYSKMSIATNTTVIKIGIINCVNQKKSIKVQALVGVVMFLNTLVHHIIKIIVNANSTKRAIAANSCGLARPASSCPGPNCTDQRPEVGPKAASQSISRPLGEAGGRVELYSGFELG